MSDEPQPKLHHAHLMASDVEATIAFFCDVFGGHIVADEDLAGSRNVLLDVGGGRVNLYDHAPNHRGPVNHLGIQVADVEDAVGRLRAAGYAPRPIKRDGPLSYSMVEGPDGLLFEIFHFDDTTPENLRPYFDLE
ncbi:MAG: VOC family protein [Actinomycetota bacterium]